MAHIHRTNQIKKKWRTGATDNQTMKNNGNK